MGEKARAFPEKASNQEYTLTQSTLTAMTSIAIALNQQKGAGFFLSGPFGSGKTHLLMALRDLSVTQGALPRLQAELSAFSESDQRQIQFVREVFQTNRVSTCYVNLGASNQSLSAALQEVIHQQHPQILPRKADLLDSLDAIDAGLLTSDYDMLIVLVDELASNLDGKNVSDASQDVIFLQQFGEALRDHRIVLVLTVHKTIRVLDGMHYDQLSKLVNRYRVLPLHIEGALTRRFMAHFDYDDLVVTMPQSYHQELYEATGIYSVHESQVEPSTPPMAGIMDPVRELAEILMERCDGDDLDFFMQSKDITGRTREAQVVELCIAEDPLIILAEFFEIGRLRELAKDLELEVEPRISLDQLREAVLVRLGFPIPKEPIGINAHRRKLIRLLRVLRLKRQRADIIGIGLEGCDDIGERVLKDVLAFYCTVLLGTDYEQVLREKGLFSPKGRQNIDGLTFGQKIGLFERLNEYVKQHEEARDRMRKWFQRSWVIKNSTHIQKFLNRVSPLRSNLAHPEGIDTPTLKREAVEALKLLVDLFEQFEEQLIYPLVIAVEEEKIDRYGRHTYICVDNHRCPEHIFTGSELVIGQEYFCYPITNPIRVDPLIVPKK